MNAYFDVFFHQQAIPFQKAKVLYQKDAVNEIVETCNLLYEHKVGYMLSTSEMNGIRKKIQYSVPKKYIEIQFFRTELYWDVLLEELVELFPQFLWTKIGEEIDSNFVSLFQLHLVRLKRYIFHLKIVCLRWAIKPMIQSAILLIRKYMRFFKKRWSIQNQAIK